MTAIGLAMLVVSFMAFWILDDFGLADGDWGNVFAIGTVMGAGLLLGGICRWLWDVMP